MCTVDYRSTTCVGMLTIRLHSIKSSLPFSLPLCHSRDKLSQALYCFSVLQVTESWAGPRNEANSTEAATIQQECTCTYICILMVHITAVLSQLCTCNMCHQTAVAPLSLYVPHPSAPLGGSGVGGGLQGSGSHEGDREPGYATRQCNGTTYSLCTTHYSPLPGPATCTNYVK